MNNLLAKWNQISLVKRIIIGLIIGIILALTVPEQAKGVVILGSLFVGALKAIAPILVLFLVIKSLFFQSQSNIFHLCMFISTPIR